MKKKRTEVKNSNSNQIPQNLWQTGLYFFWPLNSRFKKIVLGIICILIISFTIFVSLPESKKTEFMDYFIGSKKAQSPTIVTPSKAPSVNIQKNIQQHTEGDQSPAIIADGDVNINIGSKDDKKKNE